MDSLEDATRDYQAIERESPHFAESIHELAQTQVRYAEKQIDIGQRRKAFERALATLELLFILDEEEQTIAEALMLKASILSGLAKLMMRSSRWLTSWNVSIHSHPTCKTYPSELQRLPTITTYSHPAFSPTRSSLFNGLRVFSGGQKTPKGTGTHRRSRELYRAIDYLRQIGNTWSKAKD